MDETLTVTELGARLRGALEQAFPYGAWVEGEIRGLSRARNGHVYFDLVDPGDPPTSSPSAVVPVVLFRDARDRVNRLLKRHGDPIRMSDGVRIRIQAMVDFYPPSGRLQLRMSAIDPTYTLGRLAAERDALMHALADEDLVRANAGRPLGAVPLRVGLVTSLGSAAHADVLTVFERCDLAFTIVAVDTAVQGTRAELSVAAAIRAAAGAGVEAILVVRGGGSRTDLATFDHELVARAVATAPVPVITGVGHDIDRSVADEVAHTAHTTPTAAAQWLVTRVERWLDRLDEIGLAIATRGLHRLDSADARVARVATGVARDARSCAGRAAERVEVHGDRLARAAHRAGDRARGVLERADARLTVAAHHGLRTADRRLGTACGTLGRRAPRLVADARRDLDNVAARVRSLDPAGALVRGWSITRGPGGRIVRSVDDLAPGDSLTTQVADGTLRSTIDDPCVGAGERGDGRR